MIYYFIERDEIFESSYLDIHFFSLLPGVAWDKVLILGELLPQSPNGYQHKRNC